MLRSVLLLRHRAYTSLPMPALSPTMASGRISAWKKKDGERFKVDEVLCEVETDKAVVDFSAVDEGVIAKILIPAGGEQVAVGAPLAIIVDNEEEIAQAIEQYEKKAASAIPSSKPQSQAVKAETISEPSKPAKAEPAPTAKGNKDAQLSPSARSILGSDVDVSRIVGTGKNGRIMKQDALKFLADGDGQVSAPAHAASSGVRSGVIPQASPRLTREPAQNKWLGDDRGPFRDVPLTTMRRVIAQRLSESKERVPHCYATIEADIDSALEARNQLKKLGSTAIPSMNDLVVKACALALRQVSSLNVRVENEQIKPNSTVDISVAVATPGGLITPIVENADKKTPAEISAKMKDLAARAKENKLKPAEFQGGSFTVSNLGMLGIDDFTAIINPPQVAILAVGSGKRSVVVPESSTKKEVNIDAVQARTMMVVALSFDPRAVSEIHASKFLQSFRSYMESPVALFSSSATSQ